MDEWDKKYDHVTQLSKKSLLLSIDFDGTVVEHKFPLVGKFLPGAVRVLKRLQSSGHRLILNTCREDNEGPLRNKKYLSEAVVACNNVGVDFVSVNENRVEDEFRSSELRRKVYADIYIDDRNLGGFPGWDAVEMTIFGNITKDE